MTDTEILDYLDASERRNPDVKMDNIFGTVVVA